MTEIEIATGAAIAAQRAVERAYKQNRIDMEGEEIYGNRHACRVANAHLLDAVYEALKLAVVKLAQAKDREARMIEP